MDESSDDWDSEPELENATIQEASRIHRTIPIRVLNKTQKRSSSPYYCEEITPLLEFGYQWSSKVKKGFVQPNSSIKTSQYNTTTTTNKANKLLLMSTVYLKKTYANNPKFQFDIDKIPRRILTKPSRPVRNENKDNENYDYILRVNEILGEDPKHQYRVIDLLGQGTFGQVVKCEHITTGLLYSIKIIKNKSAYKTQTCMEIEILKKLNTHLDPEDKHHIIRLFHVFHHHHHLCLVFELLSYNLYDLMGHNEYKGLALETVRAFAMQILDALALLKKARIIHCDLKPENVLLKNEKSLSIKVIDFGSSCHEASRIYTYLQSRFYRSPEVLLGMTYTGAIDMWSFGCIVAELYLGLPLFPGSSEYNQLFRIVDMLGIPSRDMLSQGRHTATYFNKTQVNHTVEYTLKSREQYSRENNKNELPRKKYFRYTKLDDIVLKHKSSSSKEKECILDFLKGILQLNPMERWTPQQALQHPFITQENAP